MEELIRGGGMGLMISIPRAECTGTVDSPILSAAMALCEVANWRAGSAAVDRGSRMARYISKVIHATSIICH